MAEVEYQNHNEKIKRTTVRGVCELFVIQILEETSIDEILLNAKSNTEILVYFFGSTNFWTSNVALRKK